MLSFGSFVDDDSEICHSDWKHIRLIYSISFMYVYVYFGETFIERFVYFFFFIIFILFISIFWSCWDSTFLFFRICMCVCVPLYVIAKLENDGECCSNLSFTQLGPTATITKGANDSSNSSFSTKCRWNRRTNKL